MTIPSIIPDQFQASTTSCKTFPKSRSIVLLAKELWKKSLKFADRLINFTAILNPQDDPKQRIGTTDLNRQQKESKQHFQNDPNQQTQSHRNQESIELNYARLSNENVKTPRNRSLWGLKDQHQEIQTEEYLEQQIEKKIETTEIVIEIKPGKRGYVNVEEFLKKLKDKKEEKRARNQLKISRQSFKNIQNLQPQKQIKPEVTQKVISLFQLLNPEKSEEKTKGPRQLRCDLRDNMFKKKYEPKNIEKGQMTDSGSSNEIANGGDKAPKVEKSDNSTIYESSEEDSAEKSDQSFENISQQKLVSTKQNQSGQQIQMNSPKAEIEKLIKHPDTLDPSSQSRSQNSQDIQPVFQTQPKINPFLSEVNLNFEHNHSNQSSFNQNQVKSVVQEMKHKLFGSIDIEKQSSWVNGLPKSVSKFNTELKNSFTPNLSCAKPVFLTETPNQVPMKTPICSTSTFSQQNFQPKLSSQSSYNQPTVNPFRESCQQNNYKKFSNSTNQQFSNFSTHQRSNFTKITQPTALVNQAVNQPAGFSPFRSNQSPSFLKTSASIPTNPIFGNPSASNIFPPPINNPLAPKAFGHLIKPNLLNDDKNKMLLNSFMTPSNKNTFNANSKNSEALFSKFDNGINEDDWDKRTEKRGRNKNSENRRRTKKEERVRD